MPTGETGGKLVLKPNILYRYKTGGEIVAHDACVRIFDVLTMHTGMSQPEIISDLAEKIKVIDWLVENRINDVNDVGKIMATYYTEPESVVKTATEKLDPKVLLK